MSDRAGIRSSSRDRAASSPEEELPQDGVLPLDKDPDGDLSAELRKEILKESHRSRFTIHPGGTKM